MARWVVPALALIGVAVLLLASRPALAVDDLSVKMWYDDTVKPGQSTGVSLEIRNENYDYPVNITWTGINVEWMTPGEFAYNTTSFWLSGGQSRIVNITFQVPADAKAKKYSNYEVVYYTIQNGTNGEWNTATWESTITEDFKVVVEKKPSQDWYTWATTNAFCLCTVLIVVIVVIAGGIAARKRIARPKWRTTPDDTITLRPSASPPSKYADREFPPAPYEESKPAGPEKEKDAQPREPDVISEPPKAPSPPQAPKPATPPGKPAAFPAYKPDTGVDLMKPTDWDSIGKPASDSSYGPAAVPPASLEMGPKFCTFCGMDEPGPVCRNCGRRLV
jgi:hypothetical protein